jgi:hypothetical protein
MLVLQKWASGGPIDRARTQLCGILVPCSMDTVHVLCMHATTAGRSGMMYVWLMAC